MRRPENVEGSDSPQESDPNAVGEHQVATGRNPEQFARPAWGWGLATVHSSGTVLDTYYPEPALGLPSDPSAPEELAMAAAGTSSGDPLRAVHTDLFRSVIDLEQPPSHAPDAYLRLHLLSHRLVEPRAVNLDNLFTVLTNVVWTSLGPCAVEGFESVRTRLKADRKELTVYGVDKFPRMVDYVLPWGVRVADADRVRLGAHLAPGTVVMHEGFLDYNAGTLGAAVIEGQLGHGVIIGKDSEVGSGASIMGGPSDGSAAPVTVGERCLIGANAGVGIALGDDCVVEAGLYVTADTETTLPSGETTGAGALSRRASLGFRRNSVTGAVEVCHRFGGPVELNTSLHAD